MERTIDVIQEYGVNRLLVNEVFMYRRFATGAYLLAESDNRTKYIIVVGLLDDEDASPSIYRLLADDSPEFFGIAVSANFDMFANHGTS